MISSLFRMMWGELSHEEIKKFGFLSVTFMVLIGSYWLIRLLKDVVLDTVNGYKACAPTAKMVSLLVVIALVSLVAKLVDMVEKQTLFYIVSGTYAVVFVGIACAMIHPTIGLANTVADPSRWLGWVTYCAAESYGSITIPLFWGFVASITGAESAKRGYPIIFTIGQIGTISAPLLMKQAPIIGLGVIGFIAAGALLLFPIMIWLFNVMVPQPKVSVEESKKPKTGVLEGIRLIFTRPYLIGVFGLSTLYEVVGTIFEYQMKSMAAAQSTGNSTEFAAFLGNYGLYLNVTTLVITVLGTSVLLRRFGLLFTALLFPVIVALMNASMLVHKTLFIATVASLVLKALSYAVNNPTKELMYIPTSKDVKFKAKGLIDGFGGRLSKATGSAVNQRIAAMTTNAADFVTYGCFASFGIIAVWMVAAAYVGTAFNKLTKENKIVE